MKKVLFLLVFLLILTPIAIYYAWQNGTPKSSNGQVALTYWGVEQDSSVIQPLIDKYTQEHPNIKITYRQLSLNKYRETVQSRISSGKGPDIFRFHNTWTPMLVNELAPILSTVMDDRLIKSRFYPIVNQDLKVNGKIVGIPLDFDGLALFYNTQLLSSAGFSTPPTDWYQFRQYAQKMTTRDEKGNILVGGAALGTSNNVDYFSDILGMLFLQNGTKMISNHEVTFANSISSDSSKSNLGADALMFYATFFKDDKVWDKAMPNSISAFVQGKAAMVFAPASQMGQILKLAQTANPPIPFKVAPVPQLPNRTAVTWGSFWAEGVSKKSTHQKEAWDFINFLVDKSSLQERFNLTSNKNGLGLPYSRADMRSEQIAHPYLGSFVDEAKSAQSWFLTSNTFDNGLNDNIIKYFAAAVTAVGSGTSANTVLETVQTSVAPILTKYNLANPPRPSE